MIRQLLASILFISLLVGTLHAGHDLSATDSQGTTGCSISAGVAVDADPCHDDDHDDSHDGHCCNGHSHLQAITGQPTLFSHPLHNQQFTAIIPHLVPQDFSRIPFIPPRITS